jgi:hypothetical protein
MMKEEPALLAPVLDTLTSLRYPLGTSLALRRRKTGSALLGEDEGGGARAGNPAHSLPAHCSCSAGTLEEIRAEVLRALPSYRPDQLPVVVSFITSDSKGTGGTAAAATPSRPSPWCLECVCVCARARACLGDTACPVLRLVVNGHHAVQGDVGTVVAALRASIDFESLAASASSNEEVLALNALAASFTFHREYATTNAVSAMRGAVSAGCPAPLPGLKLCCTQGGQCVDQTDS